MNDPHLRIGDAERAAAANDLAEHFAQGRLSADEHEDRLTQIWAARTGSDLAPIFRDLPSSYADRSTMRPTAPDTSDQAWRRPGLMSVGRRLPLPVVVVLAVLLVVAVIAHLPVVLLALGVFWLLAHRSGRRHRPDPRSHWHRSRY